MDKTVNLRSGALGNKRAGRGRQKAEELAKIYAQEPTEPANIKSIKRSAANNQAAGWRLAAFVLALAILAFIFYLFFGRQAPAASQPAANPPTGQWYAITLVSGKVFYGQIKDITANPIAVDNVYYNYDNLAAEASQKPGASLRLVKRGQETYGPTGKMYIYSGQILYLEPLSKKSKVLKAIRNNEESQ